MTTNDTTDDTEHSIDPDTLDAIEADLKGAVGQSQAITSGDLADRHLPADGEANPATREAVKVLMRERDLPVIGGPTGYYIPTSQEPIDDAIASLDGRIAGIRERQQLLAENWADWTHGGPDAEAILAEHERAAIEADPVLSVADVLEHRAATDGGESDE